MKTISIFIIIYFPIYLYSAHYDGNYQENNTTTLEKFLHKSANLRQNIHENIVNFSNQLDIYLSNNNKKTEDQRTISARIEFISEKIDGTDLQNFTNINVGIKLPRLQKRLLLILENTDNSNDNNNDQVVIEQKHEYYSAGLQYFRTLKYQINFSSSIGLKINSDFDPYIRIKGEKTFQINPSWKTKLSQKFYLFDKRGFESTTSLEFYKNINSTLKASQYNEYFWSEKMKINTLLNSFRFTKSLNKNESLSYVFSTYSNDETKMSVKKYEVYIGYRKYIRRWLHWDLIPRVFWEKEDNFSRKHALRTNIGIAFGHK